MKTKYLPLAVGALSLVLVAFLKSPSSFHICFSYLNSTDDRCFAPYAQFGDIIFPISISLLLFSFIVFFTSVKTYSRWFKFTIWYVVIAFILALIFSQTGVPLGWGGLAVALEPVQMSMLFSFLYALTSIILLIASELRERYHKKVR